MEETSVPTPMLNRYWRLLNDPGFSPQIANPGPPIVSTEAFLSLTHQVQTLAGMMQIIVQHIPQLMQTLASQQPGGPHRSPTEVASKNPNASTLRPVNHSRDITYVPSDLDVISSDSTNSVREQLRKVNQRLDEVQREYIKSKEEVGESVKGRSPFVPEIQDRLVPPNFRLPSLESYDGSSNPSEHIIVFRAQLALYHTSDTLMYRAFPTTLSGPTRMWYN
ncbi:hypothetical protein B296_00018420 [Ensete ventricosum]|uniref:Uncharacterized protein n=1 Tax=Ensete ventricosum TaxID=4639 RepID=A0A426Z2P2_ENSVE|nr:hypothetical protein B296_00018420 [Ensete ventricosum]